MRPYMLSETNWKNVKETRFDLAVLPWGATEAHNYHLPYGTDVYEAMAIAEKSAGIAWEKGARLVILPAVPFGVNTGQTDITLSINLNPTTQLAIINDICQVLSAQGIQKLAILNSHGGNEFRPLLREAGLKHPKMFLALVEFYKVLDRKKYFTLPGDHADEMETSMMLYLKPELVLEKSLWGYGHEKKINIDQFAEPWAWTERKWSKAAPDTGVGNPINASATKGEMYFNDLTEKIGQFFYDLTVKEINYEQK